MRHHLAAVAGMLLLAACGGAKPTGSAQQTDPCGLLDAEDVRQYLGEVPEGERGEAFGRPSCEWQADGEARIFVKLWDPPAPEVITGKENRVAVADTMGYIASQTERSCYMDVPAARTFVQFDIRSSGPDDPWFCETVAKTAEKVLAKLDG